MATIEITCKGSTSIQLDRLKNFQGNLKELKKDELEKLKRSILKYGFSFPVFVWKNQILDGHQRIFTVRELLKDGYSIGDIPVVEIEAKDKKEASEKLLVLNSRYAKITDEGLYEFLEINEIDFSLLRENIELSDIDHDKFIDGWVADKETINQNNLNINENIKIKIEIGTEVWADNSLDILNDLGILSKKYKDLKYQVSE